MTEQEAIENFQKENKILSQYAETKFQKEVFAKKIERNNIAIKALEKQIARKPITYNDTNRADCLICKATVRAIKEPFGNWCSICGQKLDWSEEE